jgi:Ankyrin repeats (3 copies)
MNLLLDNGATAIINNVIPMNCADGCCNGLTVLMLCNEADAVKALLTAGASVHVTNNSGDTCLHVAARHYFLCTSDLSVDQSWC